MFSHVTVGSSDIARSAGFYDAALAPLGITQTYRDEESVGYGVGPDGESGFWVLTPFDNQPMHPGNGVHTAFNAGTRAVVDAFYAAAIANGGTDEGGPGLRPQYHEHYFAAYVRDPDGNKLQAVCHLAE
ncbi:MAG: VOC family protein [Pseudomonadota bacterium]